MKIDGPGSRNRFAVGALLTQRLQRRPAGRVDGRPGCACRWRWPSASLQALLPKPACTRQSLPGPDLGFRRFPRPDWRPDGCIRVIVAGIVTKFGIAGLALVTLMAGAILIMMGLTGLGAAVKFIPRPVTIGFTNGIALLIARPRLKIFLA